MQVDELLKPFPIKEFHPFPRALLGPGAHEMIGPEALKIGFHKTLVMTSGLRGTDSCTRSSRPARPRCSATYARSALTSWPSWAPDRAGTTRSTSTTAAGWCWTARLR